MSDNKFFEKQTPSSRVKAGIISEYFPSYCKIIVRANKPKSVRYIDLFAGAGYYEDGNPSTPILIAQRCKDDGFLQQNVQMIFNDNKFSDKLKENFEKDFPEGTFIKGVSFGGVTVGKEEKTTRFLIKNTHNNETNKNDHPSLLFIDPFGYKGIETKVLAEFLKNWGNEIFLFVNTKRIHPALENEKFGDLMNDLFPTTLDTIKHDRRYKSTVSERLSLIIESLGKEYEKIIGDTIYYTAFKFQEEDSDATSHYILHLTKGIKGLELVKTVYNAFTNAPTVFSGVNTYTFDAKRLLNPVNEMFDLSSANIDNLKNLIYTNYKGKEITAIKLFNEHHAGNLYCYTHYKEALTRLIDEGKAISEFTDGKIHKHKITLNEGCLIKFS
jgi:three-Cys-motif partner protein